MSKTTKKSLFRLPFKLRSLVFSCVFSLLSTTTAGADQHINAHEIDFIKRHWASPIAPQGPKPEGLSALENSLDAQKCGLCHQQQYQQWQTSLHSKTMGPGVLGQIIDMVENDPATAIVCWRCHTPLSEQQEIIKSSQQDTNTPHKLWIDNPVFDKKLQHQGLVCAGCHVRKYVRYGPPRKATPNKTGHINEERLPHGGFVAETAFTKSEFCKTCHQFESDGYALNGKLIENTYEEWKQSRFFDEGIQCQNCHMPDRKHLWKGIHDADMVRQGITITVDIDDHNIYRSGEELKATISITNSAVGHYFPTYLTPKVFVNAELLDQQGNVIAGSHKQSIIGREVPLNLSHEIYDTRIAPGDTFNVIYTQKIKQKPAALHVNITVYPDHFYERFYRSALQGQLSAQARPLIAAALENTQNSSFPIFDKVFRFPSIIKTKGAIAIIKPEHSIGQAASRREVTQAAEHKPETKISWNENNITWVDLEQGRVLAQQTGKPLMLIFYADWCPTCHAYKAIFETQRVMELSKKFIMARVNADLSPQLNTAFVFDGEYVPRTFMLNADGELINSIYADRKFPRYYLSANNADEFIQLMNAALNSPEYSSQDTIRR